MTIKKNVFLYIFGCSLRTYAYLWIVMYVWSDISYIYYHFLPRFTVSCTKLVIFLPYNNLFTCQVLCTLIYHRRILYFYVWNIYIMVKEMSKQDYLVHLWSFFKGIWFWYKHKPSFVILYHTQMHILILLTTYLHPVLDINRWSYAKLIICALKQRS